MRFTKMHGAGNDYVYVNCFEESLPDDPAELARRFSDRHFGVGGDGLILICPSHAADARMRMFNADGSEAEMCGNGIRCVAKYLYEHGIAKKESLLVETGNGVLPLELEVTAGRVRRVRVDMGEPTLVPEKIPTTLPGNPLIDGSPAVDVDLSVAGEQLRVACVSMGNPHCVTFVDRLTDDRVRQIGPKLETIRVWERGSGETLACGTGACAVCVAGVLAGRTGRKILAHLPGGDLELHWAEDNHVYMTGEAVEVFSGTWEQQ